MFPTPRTSKLSWVPKFVLSLMFTLTAVAPLARAEYYNFSGPGGVSLSGSDIMYQETRYPVWPGGTYNARWFPDIGGATATTTSFYSGVAWSGSWTTGTQSNSYLQSFWGVSNPVNPGDGVTPEWWHPDMRDVPSIGEGASGKVEGKWPFASGTWYPTALRIWQPANNPENISKVGQWCKDGVSGRWRHFSTFRMPFLATHFKSDTAFIEDTGTDGPRRVDIRNYYFRKSGTWTPGVTFKPSTRQTFESGTSGVIEGGTAAFFETSNEVSYVGNMGPGAQELTHTLTMPATPTFDPAMIGSVTATATSSQLDVKWAMTTLSSPQFSYKIEVFPTSNTSGTPAMTVTKIDPDTTEVLIPTSGLPTPTVRLTITDVFDQLSAPMTATASSPTLADASTPAGTVAGLNYKYYETSLSALPNFSTLSASLLKQQGAVNLPDLTVRKKHTSYACQFTGYVDVPADGVWLFSLGSCDGSRLRIDGATVIDSDGAHSGGWEKTGAAALKAGKHPVELQYFKNSDTSLDDDQLRLSWEGPGVAKTLMAESCWVRVPVANEPVVSLTSPAAGATILGADAPLTATVTANGNSLNSVRFFNKNTVWATKTGTASPFTTTTLLGAGANHLKARLVYGSGAAFTIDSPPVDLTATQQPLSPWTFSPIGMHAFQSAASYNAGTWSMVSDGFNITWQEISGDETIIARMAGKPTSSTSSQFDGVNYDGSWGGGVMFRENLVANAGAELGSRFVALYKENGNATRLQSSDDHNGGGPVAGPDLGSAYTWFKLQRAGTLFTASLSNDGITWTQVGTRTMASPFGQKMYVGLFTVARPSTNPNPQWWKFDNVSFASAGAGFQITQHPASQSVFPETTVRMSATVVSSNPLTYQWQHDGANIPGATAATLTLGSVQAADAGNYRVIVSDGITTVTSNEATLTVRSSGVGYQRAIEKLGPLAYWRLNEAAGPTAVDSIGTHDGTFVGALTAAQAGPRPPALPAFAANNTAIKFNGNGSRIEVQPLNLNTNTLTISAWVKRSGNAASFSGIVFSRAGTSIAGLTFGNANELRYTWNDAGNTYNWNSGLVPPDGQWTFVSLVVEPTRATIYMNPGTGLVSATNNVSHGVEAFDGALCIGQDTSGNGRTFNGTIDEVTLFNRVVSAAEIGTLSNGNTAPVFTNNPIQGPYAVDGSAYAATLVGTVNDSDPGDVLTYAKVGGPAWLNVATNGALSGTPLVGNVGANSFSVSVTDSKGATATATLNITVASSALNDAPAFSADPINLNATEDGAFTGQLAAVDMDAGDTLTFTKVSGPPWLTVSSSGALSGTPTNAEVGINAFTVRVTDGSGAFDEAALNITVSNVNDAPVFTANPITGGAAAEDEVYSGTLVGSATDIDAGDSLTYSKVNGPAWLGISTYGALSGTPGAGDTGSNNFTVRVTDAAGLTAEATLNIAVTTTSGNGTWTNTAGGSWLTTGNWSGGTPANGTGRIADFSTLNLTTSPTVTLDGSRVIGGLVFGDTTPSHNWTLSTGSGGQLTLNVASGTPGITVNNQSATISAVMAGTKGLRKAGSGTLTLGAANSFTGGFIVDAGLVRLQAGSYVTPISPATPTIVNGGTVEAIDVSSISGNTFTVNPTATLKFSAYHAHLGALTLAGGSVTGSGSGKYNGDDFQLNADVTVTGSVASTINLGNGFSSKSTPVFNVADVTGDAAADLTVSGAGSIHNPDSGTTALVKSGAGTMALANTNTYTGVTTVSAGTLRVNGVLGASATTVQTGGTLAGTGRLGGAVTVQSGGTLAPGANGIGTLTINNTLNLAGITAMELSKSGTTLTNDLVQGLTTVTYGGTLNVTATGDALAAGNTFTLFTATSYTNSFAIINLPPLGAGLSWNTSQLGVNGTVSVVSATYTLTYTAGANGTVSGTTPQTVSQGASGTAVTAVPNTGHHFVNWSDGITANPRTDTSVTANLTVTANFAINTYALTYTAGANGTLTGTSPQTVNYGGSGSAITAVPNFGHVFSNWSDGSTANPRTDANVTANLTVTANFTASGPGPLPAPWTAGTIGTVTGAVDASDLNGAFNIPGGGANISGKTDNFCFVSQPWSGNGTLTARVVSLQNTGSAAKAGVMIRESNATGSRSVFIGLTPSNGAQWVRRSNYGGNSSTTTLAGRAAPYWVRLTRNGNTFTSYLSTNGTTWTQLASASISMANNCSVGLAVCSGASGTPNASVFDSVSMNATVPALPAVGPPSPNPPLPKLEAFTLGGDTVDFNLTAVESGTWMLQESTDFVTWTSLQTLTLSGAPLQHSEADDRQSKRFFRLQASP